MSYYELSAIRASCPVLKQDLANAQLVDVVKYDEWEENIGYAQCRIPTDIMALIPGLWGCRNVTTVCSTGCPLRDGSQVKVLCK